MVTDAQKILEVALQGPEDCLAEIVVLSLAQL
jgi:hypothetical protein